MGQAPVRVCPGNLGKTILRSKKYGMGDGYKYGLYMEHVRKKLDKVTK